MAYTVHQAKTQFSKLMREAEAGREVVVMRGKKPAVKIVPVNPPAKDNPRFRLMGAFPSLTWSEDAFAPLGDDELVEMGFGYLLDVPLEPTLGKVDDQE